MRDRTHLPQASLGIHFCGVCDKEATNALNFQAQFIHRGETAASDANTKALLKVVVDPMLEDKSSENLKWMEVVASVLLPMGHGFLAHLRQNINSFSHYDQKWRSLVMTNVTREGAKGIYHLQFMALRFSKYWCNQRQSPA